jgi:undecaprenyl-diphosphatase
LLAIKRIRKGQTLKKIWRELLYLRLFVFVCIALIPTVFFAIMILPIIKSMFSSLRVVSFGFFFTGTVLFLTKYVSVKKKPGKFKGVDAFIIGIAQAVAIIPGVSRSGLTIAGGIFRGINRQLAARFSFLLAVPTIAAAACYGLKDGLGKISMSMQDLGLSFIVAFISGYVALVILSKMVAQARFHYFSYYCWTMAVISILVSINK